MTFLIVLHKELTELWRTYRILIVAAVFLLFGLASPLLAKLTPELLRSIPDLPPGLAEVMPVPTVADAVVQYVKNLGQFGILLALLMSMGAVAQEKERGTAALMATHPLPRSTFFLAKFVARGMVFAGSLLLTALMAWYYTSLLFEALPWSAFLALNGLILIVLLVYLAAALLCSTLTRSQGAAAGLCVVALIVLGGIGSVPPLKEYFPGRLFEWGTALALEQKVTAWPALGISLGLIGIALLIAALVFHHQEL